MSFTPEEVNEFKAEAFELLEGAERSLFELEAGAAFEPAFDAVFRAFHNLKGASGIMELFRLQEHVHALETLLMKYKSGTGIPSETISLFLRGIDAARLILEGQEVQFSIPQATELETLVEGSLPKVAEAAPPSKVELPQGALQEFIAESSESLERVSAGLRELEKGQAPMDLLQGALPRFTLLKRVCVFIWFRDDGKHRASDGIEHGANPRAIAGTRSHVDRCSLCLRLIS